MSKVQTLRAFVKQRLSAAAEEIFDVFERTIAEYEEELCRQHKLLEAVHKPEVRLHRADVQQLLVSQEEVPPEQQERSPSLDQEDPPEPPHIKEEQEELWSSQEGEQLPGLEEADITKFTVTPVPVKSEEDDGEKPPSSQLHQRQTEHMEADGEDCGGPGPARTSDPELQPDTDDKTEDSSDPETEDSDDDWEKTRGPQSGLIFLKQAEVSQTNTTCKTDSKPFSCSKCRETFSNDSCLKIHMRNHPAEKPFGCLICEQRFKERGSLSRHMEVHTGEFREAKQEDPPEPPHIKEEQEELWSSQEGEQLPGLEEADITKFTVTPVPVKSEEDDGEKPPSSQLHQRQTEHMEADGEDCGGPGPARTSDPGKHLQPDPDEKTSDSSESDSDECHDCEETREPQSGLNCLQNNEVAVSDVDCGPAETSVGSSQCAASFDHKRRVKKQNRIQTKEKKFCCVVCDKNYTTKKSFNCHMRLHSKGECLSCSVCQKSFKWRPHLVVHMRIHTGEKPFSCSICGKKFARRYSVTEHLQVHAKEKPFSCSVCKTSFTLKGKLVKHMRRHCVDKQIACSVCGKRFDRQDSLKRHSVIHTGEKAFTCSVCGMKFARNSTLTTHLRVHSGDKPFTCSVCKTSFSHKCNLVKHTRIHAGEK